MPYELKHWDLTSLLSSSAPEDIEKAFKSFDKSIKKVEAWRKKFGMPPADAAARMKQMRFLAGRGFAGEVVGRVVPRVEASKDFSADSPD